VSAGQASSAVVGSRMDPVRALQHALYRSAKADSGRRFHALRDKVYRKDVLWRAWVAVRRNEGAPVLMGSLWPMSKSMALSDSLGELTEGPHHQTRPDGSSGRS